MIGDDYEQRVVRVSQLDQFVVYLSDVSVYLRDLREMFGRTVSVSVLVCANTLLPM